jgi:superfamily II DNA or RNA helicase
VAARCSGAAASKAADWLSQQRVSQRVRANGRDVSGWAKSNGLCGGSRCSYRNARPQALVQVAGVQTLYWRCVRTDRMELPPADIVFVDECHHVRAMTYQRIIQA